MDHTPHCQCEIIHLDTVNAVKNAMLSEDEFSDIATLFKLFGDPTRMKLMYALSQKEMCVCDLAALLGVTKSAVSHQLKSLRLANLVRFRRDGQIVFYSLADDHVKVIIKTGLEHTHE